MKLKRVRLKPDYFQRGYLTTNEVGECLSGFHGWRSWCQQYGTLFTRYDSESKEEVGDAS